MAEIRNQTNPFSQAGASASGKNLGGLKDSPNVGAGFGKLYESLNAPRKTPSQLSNQSDGGIQKAIDNIDDAMDFATKLMIVSAKNMGMPGEEGSDNKSQEMSQMAQSIASMMATKASVRAQKESIEQQKKPALDLMSLKGKYVEYNDSQRTFFGDPVSFNYKVSHTESDPTATVNLTLKIRDPKGIEIRTIRQTSKAGEHSFKWDGTNDRGYSMPPGSYSIDLQADGRKIVGGVSIGFPVQASATLSGKVDAVKIENGSAVGLVINGKTVSRENITDVREVPIDEKSTPLSVDLIGKKVELDFSRLQVQESGETEVYFKNHIENPGNLTARIYDKGGKHLKSLTSQDEIGQGSGKIKFSSTGLDKGVYDVKLFVEDKTNPSNTKQVELGYQDSIIVAGVSNRNGTIMSIDKEVYNPIHIDSVVGNFIDPIEQRRTDYIGSQIVYRSDLFKFSPDSDPVSFGLKLPEGDAVIHHGSMNIYDENTDEMIASIKAEYDLNSMLSQESADDIKAYLRANFNTDDYKMITGDDRVEANRYIKNEIAQNKLTIADPYKDSYDKGMVSLTFPKWNGLDTEGHQVEPTRQLKREFVTTYSRDSDGKTYVVGNPDKEITYATVDTVDEIEGELKLHLVGGGVIPEKDVLSSRKI